MKTLQPLSWLNAVLLPGLCLLGACQDRTMQATAEDIASPVSLETKSNRQEEPATQDPLLAETFEKAVESLRDAGAISDMNDEDWAELEARFAERAAGARTREELRLVMQEMIETLDRSHFAIIPREAAVETDDDDSGQASVGLTARYADGIAILTEVDPGSSAAEAGIRPGWQVESVRGRSVREFLERFGEIDSSSMAGYQRNAGLNAFLTGREGRTIELELTDLDGETRTMELEARPREMQMIKFGNLPPMSVRTDFEILGRDELHEYGVNAPEGYRVGVLEFSVWMIPIMQPILRAVDEFRNEQVDAIVIDLRGNPGGVGGLAMGVGGHFFEVPTSLGTMTNEFGEMTFNTNPQRLSPDGELVSPLSTPLAILVDDMSASTSEIFAGGMQTADRAEVVGRRTPGMALPAVAEELPNGDILYHAIAEFTLPDGATVEGIGISPDLDVVLNRDAFEGSRDPDLRAAVELLLRKRAESDETPAP